MDEPYLKITSEGIFSRGTFSPAEIGRLLGNIASHFRPFAEAVRSELAPDEQREFVEALIKASGMEDGPPQVGELAALMLISVSTDEHDVLAKMAKDRLKWIGDAALAVRDAKSAATMSNVLGDALLDDFRKAYALGAVKAGMDSTTVKIDRPEGK